MLFGTQKKVRRYLNALGLIAIFTGIMMIPAAAFAYNFITPGDSVNVCADDGYEMFGVTGRIVYCFQDTILSAVNSTLASLFSQFFGALAACMSLATAFWGFQMATGRSRMALKDGGVLVVKMAALVLLFGTASLSYQDLFGRALDIMQELLNMVSQSVDFSSSFSATCGLGGSSHSPMIVWYRVDCALDILIGGLIPNSSLKLGITAFMLAAALTNPAGVFIGLLILFTIVQVVFAIARALYIYILSYFALSMMALVAPIFLPMVLFNFTRGYFEKWLRLTFGFILQPIFIFAYLAMLLAAFDVVVYTGDNSLYNKLGKNKFKEIDPNESIGQFLSDSSVYVEGGKGNASVNWNVAKASGSGGPITGPGGGGSLAFEKQETGMAGDVPEVPTTETQWRELAAGASEGITNIYQLIDRSPSNPDGISPYFFHLKIPTRQIDWNVLAKVNDGCAIPTRANPNADEECRNDYIIELFLAAIMALVTAYIFLQLLEALPFIGSGIASDAASSSGFGFGSMSPPGESLIKGLKAKISGGG